MHIQSSEYWEMQQSCVSATKMISFAVCSQLTTAQMALFQVTQGLATETHGIGAEGLVPEPCGAGAEVVRNPAQAAVTGEELRVEVPVEEIEQTRRI